MMICHSDNLKKTHLAGRFRPALFIFFLTFAVSFSQTQYQNKLENIDKEIDDLRAELLQMVTKEDDFFAEVEKLDREALLLVKKLRIYQEEEASLDNRISNTSRNIDQLISDIKSLRKMYEQQAVNAYIFARRKQDWLTFDWRKPIESLRRLRYFEIIGRHERKLGKELSAKNADLLKKRNSLDQQRNEKHTVVVQMTNQITELTSIRNDKRGFIRKLRENNNSRKLAIKTLEKSRTSLLNEIARFEREKKNKKGTGSTATALDIEWIDVKGTFTRNKGKLNWPVPGKVITKFGSYKDPVLKTTLKNTGIDIESEFGNTIKAIYKGQVSLITFLSGFGNTIILDHGNGYYSVYSHLNEIYVHEDDLVESGDIIATVGDSGSLSGPKLHFEIYAKERPVNPQAWLRK